MQNQEHVVTAELVGQLIQLIKNNNQQVRHGSISAILQYTPSSQTKLMFLNTQLILYLRKYLFLPQLTTICLSTLIHFTTQQPFLAQIIKVVQPLVLKMKQWKDIQLQLSLLLLLNVSQQEQTVVLLIGKEQQKKGYLLQILYALLQKGGPNLWIIINIFVNISSSQRGRKYIIDQQIYKRFLLTLISPQQKLRQASLKILRNVSFEWQNQLFLNNLLEYKPALIDSLAKAILLLVKKNNLLHDIGHIDSVVSLYFQIQSFEKQSQKLISQKNEAIKQIQTAIDIVLILSNSDFKNKQYQFNRQGFKKLLSILKFIPISEASKDKLQALQIFGV